MELFETDSLSGKTQPITQEQVAEGYRKVRLNKGAGGVDKQNLEDFDLHRASNLYKLWNRMESHGIG